MQQHRSTFALCALALIAAATLVTAGPLDPPAGPVTGSNKTLAEVEPRTAISAANTPGDASNLFRITQPGSYYLTGDVQGVSGKNGIQILASDVTIDLNGFTLRGVAGSQNAIGVQAGSSTYNHFNIRGGCITGWGFSAIIITNSSSTSGLGSLVEDCRISGCLGQNVVLGQNSIVRNVIIENAGSYGISASSNSIVENCSVNTAVSFGIIVGSNSIVRSCRASGVTGSGSGISTGTACRVLDCVCSSNGYGISTDPSCLVSGCTASSNINDGIVLNTGCVATGNVCSLNGNATTNGAGVHVWSFATDCRIEGNTLTQNRRGAYVEGSGSFIARNTASGNTLNNWDVAGGNTILVVQGTSAGAVLGNTGGTAPGSTDPNANFTY